MRRLALAGWVIMVAGMLGQQALAVDRKTSSQPALLSADRVSYDEELGLVVATGHVEISQDNRILHANTVTYNQRTDSVTASGDVSLLEPDGNVIFGSYVELSEGLKEGVIQNFRLLMADKSRFAAAGARRTGGDLTEMAKGVFSPCELCKDDPQAPPLWQIKAAKIVHDQVEHQVYYEDARLEMYGVPVVYSPYFSHPDPTVKRQSGFLAPRFGQSTQLGYITQIPYFWAIAPDKDLTVAPIFTTEQGVVYDGEYRERWSFGKIRIDGSITDPKAVDANGTPKPGNQIRGHVKGDGIFNLDENWRTGFNVQRETDQTYLRRYKVIYSEPTVLPANGYVEGFFGRSYNSLNAYAFQDTRQAVNIRTLPVVAPIYEYNYESEPGSHGQRWIVDASAMNLFREIGVDSRRITQRTRWELPYTSPIGEIYTLTMSMETDGYATEHNAFAGNTSGDPQSTGRVLPQTKFDWRYPWVRSDGNVQEIVEPHIALIAGPQARNTDRIPNEDSLDFELDEQNLYSLNPFPGTDRAEGGERIVYGGSVGAYGKGGGTTNLFLGQRYRLHKDDTFDSSTGLQDRQSDYVGKLQIRPLKWFDMIYRFRNSKDDFSPRRTEVTTYVGPDWWQTGTDYVSLTQNVPGQGLVSIQQITPYTNFRITQYWSGGANLTRDLNTEKTRSFSLRATYNDECFNLTASFIKNYTRDRDVTPSTTFLLQLTFKYLGQVIL